MQHNNNKKVKNCASDELHHDQKGKQTGLQCFIINTAAKLQPNFS